MVWTFKIPLEPMGKQRPRITKVGNFSRAYTPPKTKKWEKDAALVLRANWRRPPLESAVSFEVVAFRERTKEMLRKKNLAIKHCTTKPDADNVLKIALDAAVIAGVLKDDNIAAYVSCGKQWADPGLKGYLEIRMALL